MKELLLFVSLLVTVLAQNSPWSQLKVRFPMDGEEGYYDMPQSLGDPLISNYTRVSDNFGLAIQIYCYMNDPRVCLIFDMSGTAAGICTQFLDQDTKDVNKDAYDYSKHGYVRTNFFDTPAWSFIAFFTDISGLIPPNPTGRLNKNASIDELQVFLEGRKYVIDSTQPQGNVEYYNQPQGKPFIKQGCLRGMGQHYFYNVDRDVPCAELTPFFTMYDNDTLVGFGIAGFGHGSTMPGGRNWYENVEMSPFSPFLAILPRRPSCLISYGLYYGIYSLHVYFVRSPENIQCRT